MITGSVAAIFYGEPRLTHDIDLVVDLERGDVRRFADAFPMSSFYCPPEEVMALEVIRPQRGHFPLIHHETGFKADIYTSAKDALHAWGLAHRKSVDLDGETFWLAPPEYVILRKLEYFHEGGSEKHLRDIGGIVACSEELIDFDVLNEQIRRRGLIEAWEAVIQSD